MNTRIFGQTGLQVSPLGFGAGQLSVDGMTQSHCDRLLNEILDLGITLIDTAASYGDSEEKIGRAVAHRRRDYVLATKCGYKVKDHDPDAWTGENVRHSLTRSLKLLKTDAVDALLLHSCSAEKLNNSCVIDALLGCRDDGLARLIGYSGDGQAAMSALDMGVFDCLETSVNIFDQQCLDTVLPRARCRTRCIMNCPTFGPNMMMVHGPASPERSRYINRLVPDVPVSKKNASSEFHDLTRKSPVQSTV